MYGPLNGIWKQEFIQNLKVNRVYYGVFEKENWHTDLHLQGVLILKVERLSWNC